MTRFELLWALPALALCLVGCDAAGDRTPERDLADLLSQLDEPGESVVTSNQAVFVAQFEPRPGNIGQLDDGLHYGFLNPKETDIIQLGIMWGWIADKSLSEEDLLAPSDCFLEAGGGILAKKKFAKCVANLHNHCDGAWSYTDQDGNAHANGHNLVQNENGEWVLVDCDLPDNAAERLRAGAEKRVEALRGPAGQAAFLMRSAI